MLTPGLERLIQKGLAQYQTFVFGASGDGRIPVPDGSFIIITDFDYFYFLDNPPQSIPGSPAVSKFVNFYTDPTLTFKVTWEVPPGTPPVPPQVNITPNDLPGSTINFQNYLDAFFPGLYCVLVDNLGSDLTIEVYDPSGFYDGYTPAVTTTAVGGYSINTFTGYAPPGSTVSDLYQVGTHQLEFRSEKSRNHFLISEQWHLFSFIPVGAEGQAFFYNVSGFYHRDVYLVHSQDVQINILRVPPPESWTPFTEYQVNQPKSQENAIPVGYGIGVGTLPAIKRVNFLGGAGLEFYYPLTDKFTQIPGSVNNGQSEFKVNAILGRELADPTAPITPINNGKNYPLINIGYVLVNMDYNEYVKSSGG